MDVLLVILLVMCSLVVDVLVFFTLIGYLAEVLFERQDPRGPLRLFHPWKLTSTSVRAQTRNSS